MITAPKIHTDLLWDLSFLFIGLAVVYFIFVFFYRNSLSKKSWQVKERKRELSPMISEFLFFDEEASKDEKSNYVNLKIEIRQLLKDSFNRKVLAEVLQDLRKDVAGDTQERLFKLYQDLGLHNDDFNKLKSWRWEVVSKGILNLTQMKVTEAYSFITKFINDKRHTIRKQAEISVVTLKPEGINYFLDTTKFKISEWQQLKLLDVLRDQDSYQPPRFKAWLTSTNRHVVLFALRLIKYYNQNDADSALIELVKHKNNQIKEEAIRCISEFNIQEALPTLKLVFWKCSLDVKIAILNTIGELGSKKDIEFLELIEKKESNFSVRSKALASINAIVPDTIMPSKGVVNSSKYTIPEDIEVKEQDDDDFDEIFIESEVQAELSSEIIQPVVETEKEIKEESSMDLDLNNNATDSSENLNTNEENTDDVIEKEESISQFDDIINIDFLPIVAEEVEETRLNEPIENTKIDLNEMAIDFEEISIENESQQLDETKHSLEITEEEIAFLPIVTDTIEESYEIKPIEDQSKHLAMLNEIEVQYEEVLYETTSKELPLPFDYSQYNISKILDALVFYDEVSDTDTESENPLESQYDIKPQEEQNFHKIINDLINFNEDSNPIEINEAFQNEPLLEFGNEFVDPNMNLESDIASSSVIDETIQDESSVSELSIPKAILSDEVFEDIIEFKENTEESRMQLLDDIAEMGDQRELPLLNELLVNEKFATVTGRIKTLIEKFSTNEELPKKNDNLKSFNVFEDLFRTCDTEAKLILMDEIIAVGDEGEIEFLESLLEDQETEISNKAARILEELKIKLSISSEKENKTSFEPKVTQMDVLVEEETFAEYDSIMDELHIQPAQEFGIFDFNFELTEPLTDPDKEPLPDETNTNQESIFGQICAFSSRIIDKLNG